MYLVAQISPLEWKRASVCNHDEHFDLDDEINKFQHHHSSNSLNNCVDPLLRNYTSESSSACE